MRPVLQSIAAQQAEIVKFSFHAGAAVLKKLSNDLELALFLLIQIHLVGTSHMKDTEGRTVTLLPKLRQNIVMKVIV
jgi:hypothetical protein